MHIPPAEQNYIEPDIQRALDWFLSFLPSDEWKKRKTAIESYLDSILEPKKSRKDVEGLKPVSIRDDQIGWYLYLVETALTEMHRYEPTQGARVLPLFKRMGEDFDHLSRLGGIEDKIKRLLTTQRNHADSVLFEILTGLLWARNGYEVEFIAEAPPDKRPDIRASSGREEWYIECKRLAKSSDYSLREREKWLRMWRYLADYLVKEKLLFVFDITFHVELESLPDNFLQENLVGKLKFITPPCTIISNKICAVSVKTVDLRKANAHLENNYVKHPSDQLAILVAGRRDPNRGFTYVVGGNFVQIGEGGGNNRFIDKIGFAAGVFWDCDADRSIEKKARDIRGHLANAVEQIPNDKNSVVHIGLETLDGALVEAERYERIMNTIFNFTAKGKKLKWIYCHLFQSYAPPDEAWVIDETVYHFTNERFEKSEPLKRRPMVVPWDGEPESGVHWLKESP